MKPTFTIGVFGMCFDEKQRILLCHRTDFDLWNLPGGSLENNETPWDGVKREVKEETGFDVEIEKLVGIYSKPERSDIVFSFLCKVIGGQITLNDEADRIEFFSLEDIPKNTSPNQVERIRDVLANPDGLFLKTQGGKSSIELIKEGSL